MEPHLFCEEHRFAGFGWTQTGPAPAAAVPKAKGQQKAGAGTALFGPATREGHKPTGGLPTQNHHQRYDIVCVETLNVSGMLKNYHLAKAIVDSSWDEFCRQLKYKAAWQHKPVVEGGSFFPSSQLCFKCGAQNQAVKDLSVREWVCPARGVAHDWDINAAYNILKEGMRVLQKAA